MDTFRILETHLSITVCFEDSLWLALENDLFEFCRIDCSLFSLLHIGRVFSPNLVIEQTLAAIDDTSLVSALS